MADGLLFIHIEQQEKQLFILPTNHSIVKALHNALINKDNVRYMRRDDGVTTVTRGNRFSPLLLLTLRSQLL
jgi:hypothetical protein